MWKSKFYGAFVLNHRVVLHAIDATPARWRRGVGLTPLDSVITAAPDALVDFHTGNNISLGLGEHATDALVVVRLRL